MPKDESAQEYLSRMAKDESAALRASLVAYLATKSKSLPVAYLMASGGPESLPPDMLPVGNPCPKCKSTFTFDYSGNQAQEYLSRMTKDELSDSALKAFLKASAGNPKLIFLELSRKEKKKFGREFAVFKIDPGRKSWDALPLDQPVGQVFACTSCGLMKVS